MAQKKSPIWTHPYLFLSVHTGAGIPYAMRINVKKLLGLLTFLFVMTSASILGSLMFFRELEINRKLQDTVLEFETNRSIEYYISTLEKVPTPPVILAKKPTTKKPTAKDLIAKNKRAKKIAAKNLAAKKALRRVAAATPKVVKPPKIASSRIASFSTRCAETSCTSRLSLVPSSPGVVQGQLIMILETEIPRIGTSNPTSSVRKRFFIYPGYQTRDTLDTTEIAKLERKTFQYTRALNTSASFEIGKLLRPLAINVYLFDQKGNRTHHERRVIEKE